MLEKLNYIDNNLSGQMVAAVGFRSIAVHAYRDIVYSIITKHVIDFKQFIIQILARITE